MYTISKEKRLKSLCPENGDGRDSLTFRSDPTPRRVRIRKVQAYFSLSGFMRDCVYKCMLISLARNIITTRFALHRSCTVYPLPSSTSSFCSVISFDV